MAVQKFSQIALAPSAPASTDYLVGVTSGAVDYRFSVPQVATAVGGFLFTVGAGNSLNFYVATTGSDSDTGLSVPHAWATLQHASNYIATNVNYAGGNVIVNVGAGTFAGATIRSMIGGGILQFYGVGSGSTTIDGTVAPGSGFCIDASAKTETTIAVQGFTIQPARFARALTINTNGIFFLLGDALNGANGDIIWNATQNTSGFIGVSSLSTMSCVGGFGTTSYTWPGGQVLFPLLCTQSGQFFDGFGWNINAAGSTTVAPFLSCNQQSLYTWTPNSASYTVVSGTVTGLRFQTLLGAAIGFNTFGEFGALYFPGDTTTLAGDYSGIYDDYIYPVVPNVQSGSNYTPKLRSKDIFGRIEMTSAGLNTVTIETDASASPNIFPVGSWIKVTQAGTGATSIAAAVGVTGNNFGALAGQWSSVVVYKRNANEWVQTQC